MVTINKKQRKTPDLVTIWRRDGIVDSFGNEGFLPPVYAWTRYEDQSRIFVNLNGVEERGKSLVFANHDIATFGDYILLGESEELKPTTDANTVKDKRSVRSLGGKKTEYRYVL